MFFLLKLNHGDDSIFWARLASNCYSLIHRLMTLRLPACWLVNSGSDGMRKQWTVDCPHMHHHPQNGIFHVMAFLALSTSSWLVMFGEISFSIPWLPLSPLYLSCMQAPKENPCCHLWSVFVCMSVSYVILPLHTGGVNELNMSKLSCVQAWINITMELKL